MNEYYVKKAEAYMRYEDFSGEKMPILFIHGLGCAGSFDYPQVAVQKELSGHRIILVDLLGAGYSDKPTLFNYSVTAHAEYLRDFIDDLGLTALILFGHSLGGPVAIELAGMCGNKVKHLVLSEANLDPSEEGAVSYRIAQFSETYFIEKGFQELIHEYREGGNRMWAAVLSNWLPAAAYGLSKSGARGGKNSWRTMLYELPMKKGFIFVEWSLPDKDHEILNKQGIHIETVINAGHSMAWENPTGLAAAIMRCLEFC